jgi:hypothetical protein
MYVSKQRIAETNLEIIFRGGAYQRRRTVV